MKRALAVLAFVLAARPAPLEAQQGVRRPVLEEARQTTEGAQQPSKSDPAEALEAFSTKLGSIFFIVLIVGLVLAKAFKKSPPKSMPPRKAGPPRSAPGRRPPGRR